MKDGIKTYPRTRTQIIKDLELRMDIIEPYMTKMEALRDAAQLRDDDDYVSYRNRFAKAESLHNNWSMLVNSLKKELRDVETDPLELHILKLAVVKDTSYEFASDTEGLKGGLRLLKFVAYEIRSILEDNNSSKARQNRMGVIQTESRDLLNNLPSYKTPQYKVSYVVVPS